VKAAAAGPPALICVGSESEVAMLAEPLSRHAPVSTSAPTEVMARPDGEAVYVFYNEYFPRFRECAEYLVRLGVPTIYAVDGILEWRNIWELPEGGVSSRHTMRPVLCHKAACIGRSQARVLESWGNLGKCEVVGLPRLDALLGRRRAAPSQQGTFSLLVATANMPGFTQEHVKVTEHSLAEFDGWCRQHEYVGELRLQPIWRLTQNLSDRLRPCGQISDPAVEKLPGVLDRVDAVITTPSTLMLEAMLLRKPVALLDFHNRPAYVCAAWTISAREHIPGVVAELAAPPAEKLLYQDFVLHDALECRSEAATRMVELAGRMHGTAAVCRRAGRPLVFAPEILDRAELPHHAPEEAFDLGRLYPDHPTFRDMDQARLQVRVEDLRARNARLEPEAARVPGLVQKLQRYERYGSGNLVARLAATFPFPRRMIRAVRYWAEDLRRG
jgi:hypothetical protein